jgi:phage terminase large subunit
MATTNAGTFKKGPDPRRNVKGGPGRTAGYKHFQAQLFAEFLDSTVSITDKTPFIQKARDLYKDKILKGGEALDKFMAILMNEKNLETLDAVLSGQKNSDLRYMAYQLYSRCFDEQQQALSSKKPIVMAVCGRRSGKTEFEATKIIETAVSFDKGDIIYIGKTMTSAKEIIWQRLIDLLKYINLPFEAKIGDQVITLASGVNIFIRGANDLASIDKLRGHSYRLAVVDEIQSIKYLRVLVEEILTPALQDYKGQLVLSGTPPRAKGTYMEAIWEKQSKYISKFHWDASYNIFMPDYQTLLEEVKEKRNLRENDPIFQREWLGNMGVYDVDAMVFRASAANILVQEELKVWIQEQPVQDLYFSAGLDLGYEDSDAFCIVLASSKKPEKWIVWEHKANKQDISQLVQNIRVGLAAIENNSLFTGISNKNEIAIQTDMGGGGKKIAYELKQQYRLLTTDAIKQDKTLAIANLAEEVRSGRLKYDPSGVWADEIEKILYARDEGDEDFKLTKLIDDSYHPDFMDAVLYAMRPVWISNNVKLGDIYSPAAPVKEKVLDFLDTMHDEDDDYI